MIPNLTITYKIAIYSEISITIKKLFVSLFVFMSASQAFHKDRMCQICSTLCDHVAFYRQLQLIRDVGTNSAPLTATSSSTDFSGTIWVGKVT